MVQKTRPPGQLSSGTPQPLSGWYVPPIIAKRDPTVNDTGYPLGQVWDDKVLNRAWILTSVVAGMANWVLMGVGAGGAVNTINGVSPVLGNIDIIDQSGAGAITVTAGAPGSGQVGLGVNVDGVTVQIVGNQLVATAVSPALTLTGDVGGAKLYSANNFNIQGGAAGAIIFNSSAAGQMDAQVQVDNNTIIINGSNQLQVVGRQDFSLNTIGALTDSTPDIAVPNGQATTVYVVFTVQNSTNTAAASDIAQGCARVSAGVVTIVNADFFDISLAEDPALAGIDFNLVPGGGASTIQIQVVGVAGQTLRWHVSVTLTSTP